MQWLDFDYVSYIKCPYRTYCIFPKRFPCLCAAACFIYRYITSSESLIMSNMMLTLLLFYISRVSLEIFSLLTCSSEAIYICVCLKSESTLFNFYLMSSVVVRSALCCLVSRQN